MNTKPKYWLMFGLLSSLLLLLLARCGAAASPQPAAEGYTPDQVVPAEDQSQNVVVDVVEKSDAAQAKAPELGATITSDEDVISPAAITAANIKMWPPLTRSAFSPT